MKYSKIALGFLLLGWVLLIIWMFMQTFRPMSVLESQILTSSWPIAFVLSGMLAIAGKAKEKTGFTKVVLILCITSVVLLMVAYIQYGRNLAGSF